MGVAEMLAIRMLDKTVRILRRREYRSWKTFLPNV